MCVETPGYVGIVWYKNKYPPTIKALSYGRRKVYNMFI